MPTDQELKEFIAQPYVVQLYAKDGSTLENKLANVPYAKPGKRVRGDFTVFHVDSRRVHDLLEITSTEYIEMYPDAMTLLGRSSLEAAGITQVQRHPSLDLRGRGTLIGIIDTGADYTKEAFRYEDGTSKIKYIWDQTIEGNAPGDFLFGSEYTGEQINSALRTNTPHDYVPSMDTVGHGTFLASIAAGRQDTEYIGAAPDADLLVVKLRRMQPYLSDIYLIPRTVENVYSAADVMLAIDYMLDKAQQLNMPVSICIGLGSNMSGHDGYEIIEQYINDVSLLPGVCICTAAGNESNAAHHTSGNLTDTNPTHDIQIRVPENANSFILNVYVNSSDRMSVSIKSPLGETMPRTAARSGQITEKRLILERTTLGTEYYLPLSPVGDELIHLRFHDPTPGVWTVTLYGDIILDGRFHAWVPITGLATPGIQFLSPDPYTTVVSPGTSIGSITCGAYNDKNNSLYISSSWGPTRSMTQKPDLVAPGVDVSGIYPIGSGTMTGTSAATAITAGACALMLQWGIVDKNDVSLNTNRIKSLLIRGCNRSPNIRYPSRQWGYGRLNLINTFNQLRGS